MGDESQQGGRKKRGRDDFLIEKDEGQPTCSCRILDFIYTSASPD
jgi:hypothetical protein